MDVRDWLRRLGLSQYEAAFRESEIDADVLPELTDQHLKDLGVSLGHRLKILRRAKSETSRGGRAPPAHGHVLRSRRLDRACRATRSRGYARHHRRLPQVLYQPDPAQRR